MPDFTYEALASTGQRSKGTLTAASEREAVSLLDARGLFPLKVELAQASARVQSGSHSVSSRTMANFFSQLADLLRSGVPLLRSLELLERQGTQQGLAAVLKEVHIKVADGTTLADAMAQYPGAFSELAVSMVRAGQEGGFLEDVLERIASFTEQQEDLKAKVIGALAYPVFLAGAGFLVLNIIVIFFVPMFEPIFKKMAEKNELPTLTITLIAVSKFLQGNFLWLIPAVVAAIFVFWRWAKTENGRGIIDHWKLRLPLAGPIYLNLALSRFTRILGTLLRNGIPILQSLRIAKDSTGNRVLAQAIDQAADHVTAGNQLAAPLGACKFIPRDVIEMFAVGEESNQLEKVLITIADALEKRTGRNLDLMVKLLEPLMLLFMAGIIMVVLLGLLIPIFNMSKVANK